MIQVVSAVIQREDGRFLICKRKLIDKLYPGLWEFPGGKVESGESKAEALRRELKEELYLEKVNINFAPVWEGENEMSPGNPYYITFFKVVNYEGVPAMLEHDGLLWETKDEILKRDDLINPLMKEVVKLL